MFQYIVSAQCSRQCSCSSPGGSWSPMYRMLTSPPPSENDIVPRGPQRCSCGCSPRRLPPRISSPPFNNAQHPHGLSSPPPSNDQHPHGISSLSGVVMDTPVFQQMGPSTEIQTPPAVYVSSSDIQGDTYPSHTCDTSSHIMTIPRRQDSFTSYETPSNTITTSDDSSPTITYSTEPNARPAVIYSTTSDESPTTTYSTAPQQMSCQPPQSNSIMSAPQPTFPTPPPPQAQPQPQPQPIYFAQPAPPVFASCPATLFYPAAPAMTCAQPNFVYPASPSYPSAPTPIQSYSSAPAPIQSYSSAPAPIQSYQSYSSAPAPAPIQSYSSAPEPIHSYSSAPTISQSFTQGPPAGPTTSQSFTQGPPVGHTTSQSFTQGPPAGHTTSQSFAPGTSSEQTPTTLTHSQDVPCNAPHEVPSSHQTFTTGTFQNTPSNTVTFSTSDNHQTPSNSAAFNNDFQNTPSNTVFFRDADSSAGAGTLLPESSGPTVTSHDSPLTYTLLTSGTNNGGATDPSRDCSVPVPPVLV